ncbi:MAG: translation elongation factor-like protein [Candidatus Altiarchaeota archaeon]
MAEREKIGSVFSYFANIGVAAISLSDAGLSVGDRIQIQGATTDVAFTVDSMQVDRESIQTAAKGQSVGIKVPDRVRPNDEVYRIVGE